jgi:hypothetical protein
MRTQQNVLTRLQTFARHHRILATFLLLFSTSITVYIAWAMSASTRGTIAAEIDLRRGHYTILLYGLPPRDEARYLHTLKDRFGVQSKRVANCIVSQPLLDYADSYNKVIDAALQRKFNRDVFQDTAREVFGERQATDGI